MLPTAGGIVPFRAHPSMLRTDSRGNPPISADSSVNALYDNSKTDSCVSPERQDGMEPEKELPCRTRTCRFNHEQVSWGRSPEKNTPEPTCLVQCPENYFLICIRNLEKKLLLEKNLKLKVLILCYSPLKLFVEMLKLASNSSWPKTGFKGPDKPMSDRLICTTCRL